MSTKYILSIDQSTSATKAVIFDNRGILIKRATVEHAQYYPKPGWVEHDPVQIYDNTLKAVSMAVEDADISYNDISVVSITNQRETTVVWDRISGEPIYNAIVWQCQRAGRICEEIENRGYVPIIKKKTGLILSPYFSASKAKWILDNVEGAREKAQEGRLMFGTIDSWLIFKLTGGKVHATDYSNASRTQLFNIKELKWDEELLDIFTIPKSMMPEVKFSDEIFGFTATNQVFTTQIPISGVMGDSHAALFGQNCFERGMAKATYGTGSSIMMNIGKEPLESEKGLVTSIAWGYKGNVDYVFEGNINCTGATIKWLVDDLELIPDSKSAGNIAKSVEDTEGVYIVPAFVGLGAPYWDSEAKAAIMGITRGTKKAHVVRAAEECIAYQIKDILDLMVHESDIILKELRVDGGPTRDGFLMQFQADMLNVPVVRSKVEELSAMGSALMAGLAVEIWHDVNQIKAIRQIDAIFNSQMSEERRHRLYSGWQKAIKTVLSKQTLNI